MLREESLKKRKEKEDHFRTLFSGKRVLFITTKNLSYIRNAQEIRLIRESAASVTVIGSDRKSYFKRLPKVYTKLLFADLSAFDTVFIGFAPQLVLPFLKRRLHGKTVIIDFFISLYDTFVYDRKKIKENSLPAGLLKKLDEVTLCNCDHAIADTEAHKTFFCGELGAVSGKVSVLYLEADSTIYDPRKYERAGTNDAPNEKNGSGFHAPNEKPDSSFDDHSNEKSDSSFHDSSNEKTEKTEEKHDCQYTVLYFGSILPLQGVETVLAAAAKLIREPNLFFEIIGPVKNENRIPGKNITYISWLPQPELAAHIARADLCLAGHFNREIAKADRTIPGKAYIYEAMGKPMILGRTAANAELFSDGQPGISFADRGDPDRLADVILQCYRKRNN